MSGCATRGSRSMPIIRAVYVRVLPFQPGHHELTLALPPENPPPPEKPESPEDPLEAA